MRAGSLPLFIVLLGLSAGTAHADVIVFHDKAPIPKAIKDGGYLAGRTVLGRVHSVDRTDPPSLNFQPCKFVGLPTEEEIEAGTAKPPFDWMEKRDGKADTVSIPVSSLENMVHEVDGLQDLWWLFSNRDAMVPAASRGPRWGIGFPEAHAYFLAAGGVTLRPEELVAGDFKETEWGAATPLEEGWLVNVIRRGPYNAAKRARLIEKAFGKGYGGSHLPAKSHEDYQEFDSTSMAGFHPIMRETEVQSAVYVLLQVAARDQKYGGPFRGMTTTRYVDAATGETKENTYATFYNTILRTIVSLCDQVDLPGTTPQDENAREMGYAARSAVIQALEEARLGQFASNETVVDPVSVKIAGTLPENLSPTERVLAMMDKQREVQKHIAKNDKTAATESWKEAFALAKLIIQDQETPGERDRQGKRIKPMLRALRDRIDNLKGTTVVDMAASAPPRLAESLPITPTDTALIAMEIIKKSHSWQLPRYDDPQLRAALQLHYSASIALRTQEEKGALTAEQERALAEATRELRTAMPGERLTRAILDLAPVPTRKQKRDGVARANDDRRDELQAMLLGTLLHLCQETNEVYDWTKPGATQADKVRPITDAERELYEAGTEVFRQHVTDGIMQGVNDAQEDETQDRRRLAQNALAQSGFVEGPAMEATIDQLFTIATMSDGGGNAAAGRIRRTTRQAMRDDAIRTLAYLGNQSGNPQVAQSVIDRLKLMAEDHVNGFAGPSDVRFFTDLYAAANEMNTTVQPPAPADEHAHAFLKGYEDRMRELLQDDPERAGRVLQVMDALMRGKRVRLRSRPGVEVVPNDGR